MSGSTATDLKVQTRTESGSRSTRRLRREGQVPGVIYGGDAEPQSFSVEARVLRNTLAHAHAVINVSLDDGKTVTAMVKELQRHPVRGEYMHIDLLRVRMDKPISAMVSVELVGGDKAPGVVAGGVLNHEAHQIHVEALPGDIPDSIEFDVSGLELNDVATLAQVTAPAGVTFTDEPDTVIATIAPPRVEQESTEEVEEETEVIGEKSAEAKEEGAGE